MNLSAFKADSPIFAKKTMILYNITVNVETGIQPEWQNWMQNHYLPELMKTGAFSACKLCRLIDSPNEGVTYSIQHLCGSLQDYKAYQKEYGEKFRQMHTAQFPDKFVSFESLMEVVEEY